MQWNGHQNAGFSTVKPWLPVNPDYLHRNVTTQQADPISLFNFTKKLLILRKKYPALHCGDLVPLGSQHGILSYLRTFDTQAVLVALNFKGRAAKFALPQGKWQVLFTNNTEPTEASSYLAPFEVRLLIGVK
jgi:glycosidase